MNILFTDDAWEDYLYWQLVGRNKPVRAKARIGVSGKLLPSSPETPPRATRFAGLIPAYEIADNMIQVITCH